MNIIWGTMIISGIILSLFTGNAEAVTNAVINSGKDAVDIAITMCAIVPVWCGMMKIAETASIIDGITKFLYPIMGKLFPDVPPKSSALKHITANITANILGLGWAATPSGISAMQSLSELNSHRESASRAMCMFMVINMSSVQLITINIVAYRSQFGSVAPAAVIFPGIAATAFSTIVGILSVKTAERFVR